MPPTDLSFRALEAIQGSNGWARYMVGTQEKIVYGSKASEPQLVDCLGGQQNFADKSFLGIGDVQAIGKQWKIEAKYCDCRFLVQVTFVVSFFFSSIIR